MPFFHRCEDSRAIMRQMLEEIGFEVLHCSKRERSSIYLNLEALKGTRFLQYLPRAFSRGIASSYNRGECYWRRVRSVAAQF